MLNRRCEIVLVLGFALLLCAWAAPAPAAPRAPDLLAIEPVDRALAPVRAVTRGPKFHWFGYYDKHQFDPSGRYLLAMQVDFEHHSPTADDVITIGMVDLEDGDRWIELGHSRAWCWQQGCMLQWRPGSESEVLWNDREGDRFVTRILDVETGEKRTVPMAVNHVSPDGRWAVTTDFSRVQDARAGYGYPGLADPFRDDPAPEGSGVWLVDLESGESKRVVSLAQVTAIPYSGAKPGDKHRFYHCMWNTDGSRFLFYNRWPGGTRVFTAAPDGSDLRLLSGSGASHYTWRDPEHVVIWNRGAYHLYEDDGSARHTETLWTAPNGHQTLVPGTNNEWMVTDTYPQGLNREQILYLFHLPTGRAVVLGRFPLPAAYRGEWRCDLHPRVSRDGKLVVIDSPHGGKGRQQYLIDISRILEGAGEVDDAGAASPRPLWQRSKERDEAQAGLKARLAALREQYAPFLGSRPERLNARSRKMLSGDDWVSRFEVTGAEGAAARDEPPQWHLPKVDESDWETTTVPEWRYEAAGRRRPVSCILWYRKTFSAERPAEGRRVFLVFEGVDWEAEVWLSGRKLGSHRVYFEPFRFDVTDVLAEDNTLAVRVIDGPAFGEPAAYWAPFPVAPAAEQRYVRDRKRSLAGLKNGDTHIGSGYGIHRDVYLEITGPATVTELFARGYPARNEAAVQIQVDAPSDRPATVRIDLLPENFDGPAFRHTAAFEPDAAGRQAFAVAAPDAQRWTPDSPYLYRCRTTLLDGQGQVVDAADALFGFRTIELVSELKPRAGMQPGTLLLDGRPLFLRGANIQGLNALWYGGQDDTLLDALLMLKAAHFNAVRSCQHVTFPEVLELQDRLGIMSQQDVGSRYPKLGPQTRPGLLAASAAIARRCYNHPGVVLLSFANETSFDPTEMLQAAMGIDPERIFKPISGNGAKGGWVRARQGREGYAISDELWASVIDDFHPYWGWYGNLQGNVAALCQLQPPDRMSTIGEYGSEALDSYETMQNAYPEHWLPTPPEDADALWGHVQVTKDDVKQVVGLRGRKPSNLGEYIEASQNYQYDQLAELTKAWRMSPQRIAGYFQFHFIDVLPANWPKSLVSHDLTPKRAYFAMASVNQPLVPLPRLLPGGWSMELWAANDLPKTLPGCRIRWRVLHEGNVLAEGEHPVDVPASGAVRAGIADLTGVPAWAEVVDVHLTLEGPDRGTLAEYGQEVYLAAWRGADTVAPPPPVTFDFREKTVAWVEAETADRGAHAGLRTDSSKAATASARVGLAVHADKHPDVSAEWTFPLANPLEKPELLLRHAHEEAVRVRLLAGGKVVGTLVLEPTGGWGYEPVQWAWTAVPLPGALAVGEAAIRFEFIDQTPMNLDCLALAAAGAVRPVGVREVELAPEE